MLKRIFALALALSIAAGVLFSAVLSPTNDIERVVTLCDFEFDEDDL